MRLIVCVTMLALAPLTGCAPRNTTIELPQVRDPVDWEIDAIRQELVEMTEADQLARRQVRTELTDELIDQIRSIDATNTARMKEIVMEFGWPTRSVFGDEASQDAWLLVQHADHDPEFQRLCLAFMKSHLKSGEVFPQNYAYLVDRVRVNTGRKQLYGTQFHRVRGRLVPKPIENRWWVDKRRRDIGMRMTLTEYAEFMKG